MSIHIACDADFKGSYSSRVRISCTSTNIFGKMTFLDDSSSPARGRSPTWSGIRRRYYQPQYFQKRYLLFWILPALFPFLLLRLVFFYDISSAAPQSPGSTAVTVNSDELLLRRQPSVISGSAPASPSDVKSLITHERFLIRVDEDASTIHDQWITHGHRPLFASPGTYTGRSSGNSPTENASPGTHTERSSGNSPTENANAKNRKRHSAGTEGAEHSRLPQDNEKEDLSTRVIAGEEQQEEKKADQDPRQKRRCEGDNRKEEDRSEAGGAEQLMVADEKREAEGGQVNEETAADAREAEEKWMSEQEKRIDKLRDRDTAQEQGKECIVAAEGKDAEQKLEEDPRHDDERSEDEQTEQASGNEKEYKEKHEDAPSGVIQQVTDSTNVHQTEEATPGGECDLFDGDWEYDPEGPLYTNSTCFYMQGYQNCMSNGRPDMEYLHWKWKPRDCELPRFDAKSFLEAFRGKTIGFVGDSLARNQMQSLLCMLSQVEIPIQTYQSPDDNTVRWLYEQHGVTLAVVWSPYLLKESNEGIMGFEKGQSVLYMDVLDSFWISAMADLDIMVLSIGQWYFKPSVYVKQDEVVGCHYCPNLNLTEIAFHLVYGDAVRQVLEKVVAEFKGIVIMSTFAMSHFEGGSWHDGGQCRRERPLQKEEGARFPGFHNEMHDIVMSEFNSIADDKSRRNEDVKLEFLDVTKVALLRADGHPGPYRHAYPYTGRNPDEWIPNDCLHWCLPGPVDTWNQLLVKLAQKHL